MQNLVCSVFLRRNSAHLVAESAHQHRFSRIYRPYESHIQFKAILGAFPLVFINVSYHCVIVSHHFHLRDLILWRQKTNWSTSRDHRS